MNLNLGEKIRKRRKQMGFTLKELAGDRVTAAQISAVEKGKCKPSSALLEYISEKLEVDVDYFLLSEEERYRKKFSLIKEECEKLFNEEKYDEAVENVDKAKDIFQYLDDSQKGYFYYIKGKCHYTQNNYNAAFELNIQALTYYLKTKEVQTIIDIFFKIGTCLYHTEKYDMAVGYYLSAYRNANEETDKNLVGKILYNISLCYISLKKYNDAKEFIEKTYDFLDKNDFSKKESIYPGLEMMKGLMIIEQKENEDGIKNFDEAFERYKKEGDIAGMGRARNNAALCLWEIGEREKAIVYINEAIEYKEKSGDSALVESYLNLADFYKEMNKLDKSMEVLEKAENIMIKENDTEGLVSVFKTKFEYLTELKDYMRAEIIAFLAVDLIQKTGDIREEAQIYLKLSEMYKNIDDEKAALEYMIKANKLLEQI